jgi:hypothetical protein
VRKYRFIPAALILVLAFLAPAHGEDTITRDVTPGVRASFKHRIEIERETWPSALQETRAGRAMIQLEAMGGFRLHVRVRENPDDYLVCVIYVDGDARVVLDRNTRFVFDYGEQEVESTEILFTDGPAEKRVYSTSDGTIVLTNDSTQYAKARSGGYLAAVRFPGNSLPREGRWVPNSFELRGGEQHAEARG